MATYIHSSAEVSDRAELGENVKVWHQAQIREGARIGENCILSKGVYVDSGVRVGKNCKLQNRVSVYHGVTIDDGVFVGPHACFTNDLEPRAISPDGKLKTDADWTEAKTHVCEGASIGAHSVIVAGVRVGKWAMIGAGSVVTKDVPDHALVYGNPARVRGYVCECGKKLDKDGAGYVCSRCRRSVDVGAGARA